MKISEIYAAAGISSLPADPVKAARALGVKVVSYSSAARVYGAKMSELYEASPLGFAFMSGKTPVIALNENSCGALRRRFTAAHELGHIALGHIAKLDETINISTFEERQADRFAADFLAPVSVLVGCEVKSAEEISRLCGISKSAAKIRFKEITRKKERIFSENNEEKQILKRFSEFIEKYLRAK